MKDRKKCRYLRIVITGGQGAVRDEIPPEHQFELLMESIVLESE